MLHGKRHNFRSELFTQTRPELRFDHGLSKNTPKWFGTAQLPQVLYHQPLHQQFRYNNTSLIIMFYYETFSNMRNIFIDVIFGGEISFLAGDAVHIVVPKVLHVSWGLMREDSHCWLILMIFFLCCSSSS